MFLIFKYMYQTITRILQFTKMVLNYLGPVCQPILSNFLSILNTQHIFLHTFLFTYIYIKNTQTKIPKQYYSNSTTKHSLKFQSVNQPKRL